MKVIGVILYGLVLGSYGYVLKDTLYVSNGTAILKLSSNQDPKTDDTRNSKGAGRGDVQVEVIVSQGVGRAVGVAVDCHARLLFYSDVSPELKGIYRVNLSRPGDRPAKVLTDVGIVNGLTVDWTSRLLYWTDESRQLIEAASYDGENRIVLIETGLMWPRGILADPVNGWLYWGDQGERRVERCRLDGSERAVLADSSIDWPNQLALDFTTNQLYWVDAYNEVMMTLNLNDLDPDDPGHRPHRNYSRTVQLSTIYGMALSRHHAYFTTWDDGGVHVTTLSPAGGMSEAAGFVTVATGLGVMDMFSVVVDSTLQQPMVPDPPCGSPVEGGPCSHLCLSLAPPAYTCACPTYSSLVLGPDGATCREANEFILYSDKSDGVVGLITLPIKSSLKPTEETKLSERVNTSKLPRNNFPNPSVLPPGQSNGSSEPTSKSSAQSASPTTTEQSHASDTVPELILDTAPSTSVTMQTTTTNAARERSARSITHNSDLPSKDAETKQDQGYRKHILVRSPAPVAVGFDPVHEMVYWSDVKDKRIMRMPLAGGSAEVFLDIEDGIGIVDGLAIDWSHQHMYFTNRGSSRPKADGAVYHWQRVEMVALDRSGRKTLTTHVDKPRAVAVDATNYNVYYSEWGSNPRVIKMNLDGSDAKVVAQNNISNPNGLAVYKGNLYLADSNYDLKAPRRHVSVMAETFHTKKSGENLQNTSHSYWHQIDSLYHHLHTPFGIAVTEDTIFISDWKESHLNGGIITYDKERGTVEELSLKMKTPTELVYVPRRKETATEVQDCTCNKGMCMGSSSKSSSSCVCPDGISHTACLLPSNFAVFCDLNVIQLLDLDSMEKIRTIHYGHSDANYVAIALYRKNMTVYLSDLTRQVIVSLSLTQPGQLQDFHMTTDAVDGMVIDDHTDQLYWTAYNLLTYEGYIAVKSLTAVTDQAPNIVITDLHRPRAISFYDGFLYWTQTADPMLHSSGHVFKCDVQAGTIEVLNDTHLMEPNALAVGNGHIYVGDGHYNKIDVFPLDECQAGHSTTVMGSGVDHVFGMALFEDLLLFSSWHSNTLRALNVSAHNISMLLQSLYRPTAIVVHTETPVTVRNTSCPQKQLFEAASPPVFQNCPQDEVINLELPRGANYTKLPFQLFATDYKHHNLSLSTNFPFYSALAPEPYLLVHRLPKSPLHHLVYQATDDIGKTTTCSFSVKLMDNEEPRFINCPANMTVYSSSHTAIVKWKMPTAVDNVGIQAILGPGKSSGDEFSVGVYSLQYMAMDWDGNKAICNFTVDIVAKDLLCKLPQHFEEPRNGKIHCSGSSPDFLCVTSCSHSHVLNTDKRYHQVKCKDDGEWENWFPKDYYYVACMKRTRYRVVREMFQFWLPEDCGNLDDHRRQELSKSIMDRIQETDLCQVENNSMCTSERLAVVCQRKISSIFNGLRTKRSGEHLNLAIQLTMMFSVLEERLDQVSGLVSDLGSQLEHFFSSLDLVVEDVVISAHHGHLEALPYSMTCPSGSVDMEGTCVVCPPGYFHNTAIPRCQECPANTYQDEEGQLTCLPCPSGLMALEAAHNISLCVPGSELFPPHHSPGLTLGTTMLLLLFTVLLVFMLYSAHRRRWRGKQKYRVADTCAQDPEFENVTFGHHNATLVIGDELDQEEEEEEGEDDPKQIMEQMRAAVGESGLRNGDCDTIMTVMFSPDGETLSKEVVVGDRGESDNGL